MSTEGFQAIHKRTHGKIPSNPQSTFKMQNKWRKSKGESDAGLKLKAKMANLPVAVIFFPSNQAPFKASSPAKRCCGVS